MTYSLKTTKHNSSFDQCVTYKFTMVDREGKTHFGSGADVSYSERNKQWLPSWGSCRDDMEGMEFQFLTISAAMRKARQLNKRFGLTA